MNFSDLKTDCHLPQDIRDIPYRPVTRDLHCSVLSITRSLKSCQFCHSHFVILFGKTFLLIPGLAPEAQLSRPMEIDFQLSKKVDQLYKLHRGFLFACNLPERLSNVIGGL